MFKDIRNEIKKRNEEEAASKEFIQAEIERLAEEREKSKRNIFRKIKVEYIFSNDDYLIVLAENNDFPVTK